MNNIWITKDGRHIPYPKLEDQHLDNIINMLDKKPGVKESYVLFFRTIFPEGDAAYDFWRAENDELMRNTTLESDIQAIHLHFLLREKQRRKTSQEKKAANKEKKKARKPKRKKKLL